MKCRSSESAALTAPRLKTASVAAALAVLCATAVPAAHAIEFRSITEPAILYDAPSDKGKRLFILRTGTPVEIVVTLDKWIKVREPGGSLNWVERRVLANRRTLLVLADRVVIRSEPRDEAAPRFEAVRNVVLELAEPPTQGWVKVRHGDGSEGFLRASEVWGL